MNIRIYSPWKKSTNIWRNEYICLNIFKYIRISEYSSHTVTDICSFLFSCELFDNLLETWDNPILPAYLPATSNFTLFNIGEKSDLGLESVSAVLSHGLAWVSAEVVIHGSQDWPSPHGHETEGRIWWIVSTELYWCSVPETHRLWEVLQGS